MYSELLGNVSHKINRTNATVQRGSNYDYTNAGILLVVP
jgi:hypothetical protein